MNGQQDNNNHYSTENIIRYLSGKMDRAENHAFERSMVDDDLLADAVEGYHMMRQSMTDEEILKRAGLVSQNKVQNKKKKAPVVGISKYRWIGYAAAACILIASGWWVFNITQKNQVLPVETTVNPADDKSIVMADSTPQTTETPALTDMASVEKKETKAAGKKAESVNATPTPTSPAPSANDVAVVTQTPSRAMADERARAEVQNTPDSMLVAAKRNRIANVKIDPAKLLLVSVVDTADAVPAVGWNTYQDFASRQLPKPPDGSIGKAILTISPDGKVINALVSGTFNADEKTLAEKVLLNGPTWKSKTGFKAQAILTWQ